MNTPQLPEEKLYVRPRRNLVLVKRDDAETMSKGGIIIPDKHKDWARTGTVLAVGKKVEDVKPGDRVLFIWSAGFDVRSFGVEYNTHLIMKEDDILGTIDPDVDSASVEEKY